MRPLVIGVGREEAGDDAAGRLVVRALARRAPDCDLAEAAGSSTQIMDLFEGRSAVVIADACRTGAPAGTLHRFDAAARPLPAMRNAASSHGFGLAEAIELARALGRLPETCVVFGIEGEAFSVGQAMTPQVLGCIGRCAGQIAALISEGAGAGTGVTAVTGR